MKSIVLNIEKKGYKQRYLFEVTNVEGQIMFIIPFESIKKGVVKDVDVERFVEFVKLVAKITDLYLKGGV